MKDPLLDPKLKARFDKLAEQSIKVNSHKDDSIEHLHEQNRIVKERKEANKPEQKNG